MYNSKHYIIVFITSLFIVLSYEIKDLLPVIPFIGKIKFVTPILSAILGFIFSSITIDIFKNILFKFKWIRKKVIGTLWLEGYWFCRTFDDKDGSLLSIGIVCLSYTGKEPDLKSTGYHLTRDLEEYISHSQKVLLLEDNLLYINYISARKTPDQFIGVAVGNFSHRISTKFPDFYDGKIIYFQKGFMPQQQISEKIYGQELRKIINVYGNNWQREYLLHRMNQIKGKV